MPHKAISVLLLAVSNISLFLFHFLNCFLILMRVLIVELNFTFGIFELFID